MKPVKICEKTKFKVPKNPMPSRKSNFHRATVRNPLTGLECTFTVPKRYTELVFCGFGAQGTVVKAKDKISGKSVAIKKMQQLFGNPEYAKRSYREIVLLSTIKHPNIIHLLNAFTPTPSLSTFTEVYLVMELMECSLFELIYIKKAQFNHRYISYIIYQILRGIQHLHCLGITHRDLKPGNIALDDKCNLKILDFGLARQQQSNSTDSTDSNSPIVDTQMRLTNYVVTRYYRPPEVILGLGYTNKVDIWSIGCIFAELVNRKLLFPGTDPIDQGSKIFSVLGLPDDEFMAQLEPPVANYTRSFGDFKAKPFSEIVPDRNFLGDNPSVNWTAVSGQNFLSKMLKLNPADRCSVEEALNDPYLSHFKNKDNTIYPTVFSPGKYDPVIEMGDRTLEEWKGLIYEEVQRYQKEKDVFQD